MHVERAASLTSASDDGRDLVRLIGRLRLQLGLERGAVFALRGLMGAALAFALVSVLEWIGIGLPPGVSGVPLAGALALTLARWPSADQAARQADRRLGLAERLGTAIEIAGTRGRRQRTGLDVPAGRFDRLQVRDAVAAGRDAPGRWLWIDGGIRRELLLLAALLAIAASSRLLADQPRPSLLSEPSQLAAGVAGAAEATRQAAAPSQAPDLTTAPPGTADRPQRAAADPSLAERVQQAQAEQDALDRLSDALGQVSAGRAAADAIQRGDYAAAGKQLADLGEQADQLTDAAKQRLASALNAAASGTTGDRQLAERERQAAQALTRTGYAAQQQALQQLGEQVQRSGSQTMPPDQLARSLGQLQQTNTRGSSSGSSSRGGSSSAAGSPQTQGSGMGQAAGAQGGSAGDATGASAGPDGGGGGDGQQGGPGVGTGPGGDPLGDPNSRLDTSGQRVDVPTKLSLGLAVRPPDPGTDESAPDATAGARSVSESTAPQPTGQVVPEQNLVPGQQRSVVRGYFR